MIETNGATATLLLNGMVLVTGGDGPQPDSPLTTAELYDPSTGLWTATGNTIGAAFNRTATLLSHGTVLLAGGSNDSGPLTAAELYDPSSGTWSATGEMVEGGSGTATRLLNGKVLVAGGNIGSSGDLTSAELYDPSLGTWSATGEMVEGGGGPATLLPDGRVLVTGSCCIGTGSSTSSAQLYDPRSGTWAATASMAAGRFGHTAVLLSDGRVLVAGGITLHSTGIIAALASAELYDPSSGSWTATGSMIEARTGHQAILLLYGQVLVAGGDTYDNRNRATILASAELYDPISGTWSATAEMIEARSGYTATLLLNGQVLVADGGFAAPGSAELYDAGSGS